MKKKAKASASMGKKSSPIKSKTTSMLKLKAKVKPAGKAKKSTEHAVTAKSQTTQGPKKLLMKLAEDPQIKQAMDNMDHGANNAKIESFRDTVQTFMSMSRSFVGNKRALQLAAYAEVMIVAYRVGLLLKTNILDRPEVKAYLEENLEGLKKYPAYKVARSFITNTIGKEASGESEQAAAKSATRSAKAKWNESNKSDESEEETEHLNRQQRRHQQEREANIVAMKNQGNAGPNRAEKRHAKGQVATEEQSEAHSEFIPSHKPNQGKAANKNASKH